MSAEAVITNPNRLGAEWQVFYRRVLPDGAGEVQTKAMRRAFYAGAAFANAVREGNA